MRVREWYGWHFPEMTKIVADNIAYAKTGAPGGRRLWQQRGAGGAVPATRLRRRLRQPVADTSRGDAMVAPGRAWP